MMSSTSPAFCDPFERSAKYYDAIHQAKDYDREADVLLRYLRSGGPVRRVLEVGCGTGQFAKRLAGEFPEVLAVDPCRAMLDFAIAESAEPPPDNLEFRVGDFETLAKIDSRQFGGACCMFGAMSYAAAKSPWSLRDCLKRLRAQLFYGSIVVFDVLNVACCAAFLRQSDRSEFPIAGGRLVRYMRKRFDVHSSLVYHDIRYGLEVDGRPVDDWQEKHIMRAFTPSEVQVAMNSAGFEIVRIACPPDGASDDGWSNGRQEVTIGDYYLWAIGRAV